MEKFVGIGVEHPRDNYKEVSDILASERPDLVVLERHYRFDSRFSSGKYRDTVSRIENGTAQLTIERGLAPARWDQSGKRSKIYLDELCMVAGISKQGSDQRAAIEYAFDNAVPIYFIDEPFLHSQDFSREARTQGIIGFQSKPPKFEFILTGYNKPRILDSPTVPLPRTRERNEFMAHAIAVLEAKYNAKTIACIGGADHFNVPPEQWREVMYQIYNGGDYAPKDLLPNLVQAGRKVVFDLARSETLASGVL